MAIVPVQRVHARTRVCLSVSDVLLLAALSMIHEVLCGAKKT